MSRKYSNGFWAFRQPKIETDDCIRNCVWVRVCIMSADDVLFASVLLFYVCLYVCDVHQLDWVSAFLYLSYSSHSWFSPAIRFDTHIVDAATLMRMWTYRIRWAHALLIRLTNMHIAHADIQKNWIKIPKTEILYHSTSVTFFACKTMT